MKVNIKQIQACSQVFTRMNILRRWTSFISEGRYNELAKQALNCCICQILATEAEERGKKIIWERFPKIAIYRSFQKAYINYDTPEEILSEICKIGDLNSEEVFKNLTMEFIEEKTDREFSEFISEAIGTYEETIYKAATKIATLIEFQEISSKIVDEKRFEKYEEIRNSMVKYQEIPGFNQLSHTTSKEYEVFEVISRLRNQNRWAAYSYQVDCSVLGHLFDTAVFAYLLALDKEPLNLKKATDIFFMGILHDIPEAYTKDIPSPVKDRIPGFRELTEKYELLMMEKHVYPAFSSKVSKKLRSLMMEEEENKDLKPLLKDADYLSASVECYRQIVAGSRDEYFPKVIKEYGKQEFLELAKSFIEDLEKRTSKICKI